jgi:hypothetical protein
MNRPEILDVQSNTEYIADIHASEPDLFALLIQFSEAMNTDNPVLATAEEPSLQGVIIPDLINSFWASDSTFNARFLVSDNAQEIENLSFKFSFGKDLAGNEMDIITLDNLVHLDTKNPELNSVSSNLTFLTNSEVGAMVDLELVFDEPMQNAIPAIEIQPAEANEFLIFNSDFSVWMNELTYQAGYVIEDALFEGNISLIVSEGKDLAGNAMISFEEADFWQVLINTLNLNQSRKSDFQIYPTLIRPGQLLSLLTPTSSENLKVEILDLKGRRAASISPIRVANEVFQFTFPELAPGMYIIRLGDNQRTYATKIIVPN